MTTPQNNHLTNAPLAAILYLLSPHVMVRISLLEIHGANRHQSGFFMRKISVSHIMSGWVEHSKEWPGRVSGKANSTQSGTMFSLMLSGLKPFTHEMQS